MPNRSRNSNATKFSTQLGRVVGLLVIAGIIWLVNTYILSSSESAADDSRSGFSENPQTPTPTRAETNAETEAFIESLKPLEQVGEAVNEVANETASETVAGDNATMKDPAILPPTDFIGGWPQASVDVGPVQLLVNTGYAAGYSAERRTPLWVAYELIDQWQDDKLGRSDFAADSRVEDPVEYYDYSRSGYTRGHLAPSFSIGKSHGAAAQVETFLMTNIAPQLESFNRKWWQRLEEVAISRFTRRLNNVWVITGPVFDANRTRLDAGVDIPDAFYKILLAKKRDGNFISLAFLVPQTAGASDPLSQYLTTIDDIEQQTGIDFLVQLPDTTENGLERQQLIDRLWKLSEVDNLPARY